MRITIIHPLYDQFGGEEYFSIKLALALRDTFSNAEITLLTVSPTDIVYESVKRYVGEDVSELFDRVERCCESLYKTFKSIEKIGRFSRVRRLLFYERFLSKISRLIDSGDSDVVYIETQSNIPSHADISYIHFPLGAEIYLERGVRKSFYWSMYDWLVYRLSRYVGRRRPGLMLTNSKWSASIIHSFYKIYPLVVYPPVESRSRVESDKRDLVLTVSRYSPEKNLESIIRVASLCREYEFIICGSTSGEVSKRYIERLENLIDSLRLDNIILRRDCPRSDVERLYREAKIYLHPVYPEHFGIAIAEAMSFGVVPLVFRDGGAYTDLVPDESYGYSEVNEACSKIRGLIRDRDLWLRMSVRAWERSRYFSYDSFRDKITRIVRYVYALKLRDSEIIRSTDLLL